MRIYWRCLWGFSVWGNGDVLGSCGNSCTAMWMFTVLWTTQYALHCQADKRVNFNCEIGKILVSGKYNFPKACLFINLCTCLCEVCAHVYRGQRLMLGVIFYAKPLLKEMSLFSYSCYIALTCFSQCFLAHICHQFLRHTTQRVDCSWWLLRCSQRGNVYLLLTMDTVCMGLGSAFLWVWARWEKCTYFLHKCPA